MEALPDQGAHSGFQSAGSARDPSRPNVIALLEPATYEGIEPIYYGSNHTFLVTVRGSDSGSSLAIYKPARGEYPLYDFPTGSLYRREVASWLLDSILQWNLVPPTVVSRGPYGIGSLQLFIEAARSGEVDVASLRRLCLLDVLLNNADRKAEHCLVTADGKLWAIDHGLTFHYQPKLRTVLWHFAGSRLDPDDMADLKRLRINLTQRRGTAEKLSELISGREWGALSLRLDRLIRDGSFPDPRYKPVPYRW